MATVRAVCPGAGARAIARPSSSRLASVRLPARAAGSPRARSWPRGTSSTRLRAWPKWLQPSEPAPAEPPKAEPAPAEPPKADPLPPTPTSKATIDALCDILGEQCEDEEAKRAAEEAEADRVRAERAAAIEAEKSRKGERLKAFRAVSTSTLRLQQLQMVFLDLPILPTALHDLILGGAFFDDTESRKQACIFDFAVDNARFRTAFVSMG